MLTPGVPLTHPEPHWTVVMAQQAGIEVIGDIELFCRERAVHAPGSPLIAITGTNGKSTTTALAAHVLREAGYDVQMGGNIGVPILDLEPPSPDRIHVVECSTFQIDLAPSLQPSVGVLLNLTPDHLDRHGTMENYAGIKQRLVEASDYAIIGRDDAWSEAIFQHLKQQGHAVVGVTNTRSQALASICYDAGRLRRVFALPNMKTLEEVLVDLARAPALRGAHNGQNAAAVFAACERIGLPHDEIGLAMRSFPGLAHRMEQIGKRGKVLFVNDSKATNADAAEKALLSFDPIFWILGGKAKEGGIEPLRPLFGRIAKAYLIGEASADFAQDAGTRRRLRILRYARRRDQGRRARRRLERSRRSRSCCYRRLALPTINSPISRSAATPSAIRSSFCWMTRAPRALCFEFGHQARERRTPWFLALSVPPSPPGGGRSIAGCWPPSAP